MCIISSLIDNDTILIRHRHGNIYIVDLNDYFIKHSQCLIAMNAKINETSWLWHRRLEHASMNLILKLIKKDLVKGLSKLNFEKNRIYDACQFGK